MVIGFTTIGEGEGIAVDCSLFNLNLERPILFFVVWWIIYHRKFNRVMVYVTDSLSPAIFQIDHWTTPFYPFKRQILNFE